MRPLKFFRQLLGIEILADMRQPLFQLQQRTAQITFVRDGDVAPHRIRTTRDTRQFTQRTAADVEQRRVFPKLIHQGGGERGRNHLR